MEFIQKIKNYKISSEIRLLLVLGVLSLIIRLFYIYKDYPFIFHPDEPTVVNSTINLRYNLNPKHFDWPTGYYYINYIFYGALEKTERILSLLKIPHSYLPSTYNYYILSRIVTAVFGSLSVVFTYLILKNIVKDTNISLVGGVVMALLPLHVSRSAMVLTDIPLVFFSTLSIYYLTLNFNKETNLNFYLSCFFAGFAVSMKYNAYMVFLTIFLYVFFISGFKIIEIRRYILMVLTSIFGFFIGTPYAFIDSKTFLRDDGPAGALWQFKNVGSVDNVFDQLSFFIKNLFFENLKDSGYIPWILSILISIYFIYVLYKKTKFNNIQKITLIFIVQFLYVVWAVSGLKVQRSHYFILVYSFIPLLSALVLYYFPKFRKLILVSLFFGVIFPLFSKIESDPLSTFYNTVKLNGIPQDYNFAYNSKSMKPVLERLKVESDNVDFEENFETQKYTHAISRTNLCNFNDTCIFELKFKYQNTFNNQELYIYEIKK